MLRVIGGVEAGFGHGFRAIDREITVQLEHRVLRFDQIVSVDLDLVIVLGMGHDRGRNHQQSCQRKDVDSDVRAEKN